MNTKLLMTVSSILLGATGILLSFLPQEAAALFDLVPASAALLFQLMGALYFGFAMINWTAKGNLIGGIYGRPVAIGNFTHFLIGALALLKAAFIPGVNLLFIALAVVYTLFAVAFGYVFFTHPLKKADS